MIDARPMCYAIVLFLLASALQGDTAVSRWDFEGSAADCSSYFSTAVADTIGSNDSYIQIATKECGGAYQGDTYARMGHSAADRILVPTTGMNTGQGSVSFAWRVWSNYVVGDIFPWDCMFTTPVSFDGVYPMRFECMHHPTTFMIMGGPDHGERRLNIGDDHPIVGSAMDGNWHTFKMTWHDGETVKVYVDDVLVLETAGTYDAGQYQLFANLCLGNRREVDVNGCQGNYDAWMVGDGLEPQVALLPADFDGNGIVDLADFALLARNWLGCTDPQDPTCTP